MATDLPVWREWFPGGGQPGSCTVVYLILAEHQAELPSVLPLLPFLHGHGMFWATHRYHQHKGATSWWIKLTAVAVMQRIYLILYLEKLPFF